MNAVTKHLPVLSASQISTYELCPRKWAYGKIDGLVTGTSPAAQFGSEVHKHLETWLEHRELPPETDTGKVALAMIPHLPAPQAVKGENVEGEFTWSTDELAFRGFIDLVDDASDPITVYDHKTTGSLNYAKTPSDLIDDPQATLYAQAVMAIRDVERVKLRWTYATRHKQRPEVRPVEVVVSQADIQPRIDRTLASAREMQIIHASGVTANDVPANTEACSAFGGCPFDRICTATTPRNPHANQGTANMSDAKNTFLQRLQARKAGLPDAHQPAAINPPEAAQHARAPSQPPPAHQPAAINPPEAAQHARAPSQPPPARKSEPTHDDRTDAPAAPVKRGPGRPRKVAPPSVPPPAGPSAVEPPPPAAQPIAPAAPRAAVFVPATTGWTLYLDCTPVKGGMGVEHLSARLSEALVEFTAETGLSHYRLAEYGKGPALFGEGFARLLAANPPLVGIVASTAAAETRDVLQVLMAAATTVVQG